MAPAVCNFTTEGGGTIVQCPQPYPPFQISEKKMFILINQELGERRKGSGIITPPPQIKKTWDTFTISWMSYRSSKCHLLLLVKSPHIQFAITVISLSRPTSSQAGRKAWRPPSHRHRRRFTLLPHKGRLSCFAGKPKTLNTTPCPLSDKSTSKRSKIQDHQWKAFSQPR